MRRAIIRKTKKICRWLSLEIKFRLNGTRAINYFDIPIVINNYNRLETLKTLIDGLTSRGYHHIYIVDNDSTYPPLLDFYRDCPYTIYKLNQNVGHLSIWQTGIYKQFTHSYFVYTDSDLQLREDCPADFMERFVKLLQKYPSALKVGFSIAIDDLPVYYAHKDSVEKWESQFWSCQIEQGVYRAPIDTTFAVYKPYFKGEIIDFNHTYLRVGAPYIVRHLPWYVDSDMLSDEEQYYIDHLKTSTHWSKQSK